MKKILPAILCVLVFSITQAQASDTQSNSSIMIENGKVCSAKVKQLGHMSMYAKVCIVFCRTRGGGLEDPSDKMLDQCNEAFSNYITGGASEADKVREIEQQDQALSQPPQSLDAMIAEINMVKQKIKIEYQKLDRPRKGTQRHYNNKITFCTLAAERMPELSIEKATSMWEGCNKKVLRDLIKIYEGAGSQKSGR